MYTVYVHTLCGVMGAQSGRHDGSMGRRDGSMGKRGGSMGKRGGSMVALQTVVLQSRVRVRQLPSPQLTDNLLVGCHLGWHLAAG
jgi:hypothetical protein